MPEGPELHLASLFVNRCCSGVVFTGAVQKSEVSKQPEVPFSSDAYSISAVSRGKEVRLTLKPFKSDKNSESKAVKKQTPVEVVFRFGMSGFFRFTTVEELPKHAHLRFYTNEKLQRVLSFVDPRRFGSWKPDGKWQQDRGPCVMMEYESFRENVLSSLSDKAFDRPICEALLNQKYFNGIGNYLRAEILYRSHIAPFEKARTVLERLKSKDEDTLEIKEKLKEAKGSDHARKRKAKIENPDVLALCNIVPLEVIDLGKKGYHPEKGAYTELMAWMQCYGVDGMNSLRDHNGRTVWFKGDPGPMAPKKKGAKSPKMKRKMQKDEHDYTDTKKGAKKKQAGNISEEKPKPKKAKTEKKKKDTPTRQSGRSCVIKKEAETKAVNEKTRPKVCRRNQSQRLQTRRTKCTRGQSAQKLGTKAKDTTKQRRNRRT